MKRWRNDGEKAEKGQRRDGENFSPKIGGFKKKCYICSQKGKK